MVSFKNASTCRQKLALSRDLIIQHPHEIQNGIFSKNNEYLIKVSFQSRNGLMIIDGIFRSLYAYGSAQQQCNATMYWSFCRKTLEIMA